MDKTLLVKLGGSTLGGQSGTASPDTTLQDLLRLTAEGWRVVLVHGGGNATTDLLKRLGIESRFLNGLRVTDAAALQAMTMMIRGQINTDLVQSFNRAALAAAEPGTRPTLAIGMSGVDGCMLEARRETRFGDIGYVGEVVNVNPTPLVAATQAGLMPVVAPLGYSVDEDAQTFNLNADTAAAAIAASMGVDACVFLTDVPGVLDSNKNTIKRLGVNSSQTLIDRGVITGGMIPKIAAALKGLEGSRRVMILDGRQPGALYNAVSLYRPNGTTFVRRILMEVELNGQHHPANHPAFQISSGAPELDLLSPAFNRAYRDTLDYEWDTEEQGAVYLKEDFSPDWGSYLPDFTFAIWKGAELAGYCHVVAETQFENQPCLANIFVVPEFRGQGVGETLVSHCLESLYRAGYKKAHLRVTDGNDAAYNLYLKLGFQVVRKYDV